MRLAIAVALLFPIVSGAHATVPPFGAQNGELIADGWQGFMDVAFILASPGSLLLATGLGARIAFHPMTRRSVDTLAEVVLPKVYIMYAAVGAVIGVTVLKHGMVVGVVVFGVGGADPFPYLRARPEKLRPLDHRDARGHYHGAWATSFRGAHRAVRVRAHLLA